MRRRVRNARGLLARDWTDRAQTLKQITGPRRTNLSIENVHKLRVTTRRLRSTVVVVRQSVDAGVPRVARRELRALGRALGERRMWDVAIRDARAYGIPIRSLQADRARSNEALRAALQRKHVESLLAGIQTVGNVIPAIRYAGLARWLAGIEREFRYRIEHPPRTKESRHRLRIRVKKTRYLLEALGLRPKLLQQLQDHLGRERDLDVLQSLVGPRPAIKRDEREARLQANKVMVRALRSGIKDLRRVRREMGVR